MSEVLLHIHSSHGVYRFYGKKNETLGSALKRAGIPISAVTTVFALNRRGKISKSLFSFLSISQNLSRLNQKNGKVVVQLSRNIALPDLLSGSPAQIRKTENPVSEWIFPDKEIGGFKKTLVQLSAEECKKMVSGCVNEVFDQWPKKKKMKLIVGVSGGGDSNVLLSSLIHSKKIQKKDIFPVMMLGIPDWDKQVNQALSLCKSYGLKLQIINKENVERILSIKSLDNLIFKFKREFSDADLEFLGTFLLRKVLSSIANSRKVNFVAVGANREDLLSEGIARLSRGLPPLPAPFRQIGNVTFVYPMWKIPKKIGDGAFPRFSLVNYENRDPSFSEGRCIFYYAAYAISDICPGLDITLLEGFSKLSGLSKNHIVKNPNLEDFVCNEKISKKRINRWKAIFQDT